MGIDRIIAEAGVAKATFYNHFRSKDELVVASVQEQDRLGRAAGAWVKEASSAHSAACWTETVRHQPWR